MKTAHLQNAIEKHLSSELLAKSILSIAIKAIIIALIFAWNFTITYSTFHVNLGIALAVTLVMICVANIHLEMSIRTKADEVALGFINKKIAETLKNYLGEDSFKKNKETIEAILLEIQDRPLCYLDGKSIKLHPKWEFDQCKYTLRPGNKLVFLSSFEINPRGELTINYLNQELEPWYYPHN